MDRPWVAADQSYLIQSRVMPGYTLEVWRTDGRSAPPTTRDRRIVENHVFVVDRITHLRNYNCDGRSSTFDVAVIPTPPTASRR